MNRVKLVSSMLVIAALVGTAQAEQLPGAPCPAENNGTFGEAVSQQGMICANGQWQDPASLPLTSLRIDEFDAGKQTRSVEMAQAIGVRGVNQSSNGQSLFAVLATVVSINRDNTAHVVMDLDESRVNHHVDMTVAMSTPTPVFKGEDGHEYRVTVKSISS